MNSLSILSLTKDNNEIGIKLELNNFYRFQVAVLFKINSDSSEIEESLHIELRSINRKVIF